MKNGGQIVKKKTPDNSFSLLSPIDDSDIGNQAFKIREIFMVFKNRYNLITNIQFTERESILKYLINP